MASPTLELVRGQNVSLEHINSGNDRLAITVRSRFPTESGVRPDVSVLLLGADGKVRSNSDFVFYNQREAAGGSVRIAEASAQEGEATEAASSDVLLVDLASLPEDIARVVVSASLDQDSATTFEVAEELEIVVTQNDAAAPSALFRISIDEPVLALLFGEVYRRGLEWKFRAIGQGFADGLGALATEFGVEVDPQGDEVPSDEVADIQPDSAPTTQNDHPAGAVASGEQMTIRKILRAPKLPVWSISEPVDKGEWDRARLFSVSAIGSGDERERRAVSAVLSVMSGVREFGREMVRRSGGPVGTIETFIEPEFDWQEKRYRPDGLLRVTRGAKTWTALIEAKSSTAKLTAEQVQIYVDIARSLGFDAVITVSNQLPGADDEHPVKVDRRKLKKVALHHLSWDEIRSVAISMSMHKQVEDSSQGWVLREFVRYLQHPKSGLHGFTDMGPQWGQIRESVKTKTLNADSKGAAEVCHMFDQLVRHIGHDLSCLLSVDVRPIFPRNRADSTSRAQQLADSGVMFGSLRVPGAAGPLTLSVDLRSERVECSMTVDAPKEGRSLTRVNWLTKQLAAAHKDTLVEAVFAGRNVAPVGALLGTVRQKPEALLPADGKPPKQFKITRGSSLERNRGNVVASANKLVEEFYRNVVQVTRPPRASKPSEA